MDFVTLTSLRDDYLGLRYCSSVLGSATMVIAHLGDGRPHDVRPNATGGDSRYGGKRRRQATAQAERQIHAASVCTRTQATHTQQFSVRSSMYGKVSRREDKSSNGFIRRVFR